MLPTLWPGDVIDIEGCSVEDVRPGEIVLALREDRLVLHRLIAPCAANGFRLRGDCVAAPDPQYPREALLGRLVRGGGADLRRGFFSASTWSRAVGMLLCHCGVARRLALKLHSRRRTPARAFRRVESL